ncbi:hypothetical protein [Jannaschia aquimarina]|uniref:Uncharacterized protein n=1 Tax=Jannaschia aquimarina TaxID=935700 RepID=A0A0D1EMR4_9RHOB|nr:hypothetical protein [Jannaschia aquimarina]KIT16985.1 hypothetical protein jaqu_11750 [Jannaschia aquimarina]SNS80848.1 hypothetical protein SAMN05421775_102378 [Jannaschia aquimarina]
MRVAVLRVLLARPGFHTRVAASGVFLLVWVAQAWEQYRQTTLFGSEGDLVAVFDRMWLPLLIYGIGVVLIVWIPLVALLGLLVLSGLILAEFAASDRIPPDVVNMMVPILIATVLLAAGFVRHVMSREREG